MNPTTAMHPAPPAPFSGYPPTSIPAVGFARVGPGSTASRQQTLPGAHNGYSDSRSYGREPSYRVPNTRAKSPPSSSRQPYSAFTTASRNGFHNPPRPAREEPAPSWALSSSDVGSPANSFSKASANAERRPESTAPYGANTYGSPPNAHTRAPNTQIAAAHAARNLYTGTSPPSQVSPPGPLVQGNSGTILHPPGTLSLSPPMSTIPNRRSPSPLRQFETAAGTASRTMQPAQEFPRKNNGPPEFPQGMIIDPFGDPYSRHGGRTAAIPPQPSILPASSLVPIEVAPIPSNPAGEIKMCVVCFEQGTGVRFAARSPTVVCQHGATVCVSCLEQHILIAIHKSRTVDIRCPHEGCGKMLDYQDVYCSVREWSMLGYYEQLLIRREMGNTEQFVWCKNPICTSGQVHKPGPAQPIVTCNVCRQKSCYIHDRPWHEGVTCEEFDAKLRKYEEQDRATRTYLVKNTKSCPKCKRKRTATITSLDAHIMSRPETAVEEELYDTHD
ncbi:hypothetical protein FRC11_011710 [Ceratobasidium sp. 423]|nr:hypothetical protein FRC11_011710 [Ceratobasidium sp. 423]